MTGMCAVTSSVTAKPFSILPMFEVLHVLFSVSVSDTQNAAPKTAALRTAAATTDAPTLTLCLSLCGRPSPLMCVCHCRTHTQGRGTTKRGFALRGAAVDAARKCAQRAGDLRHGQGLQGRAVSAVRVELERRSQCSTSTLRRPPGVFVRVFCMCYLLLLCVTSLHTTQQATNSSKTILFLSHSHSTSRGQTGRGSTSRGPTSRGRRVKLVMKFFLDK